MAAPIIKSYKHFKLVKDDDATVNNHHRFIIFSNDNTKLLATISFYPPWKRFVAQFNHFSAWSTNRLTDLNNAIKLITKLEADEAQRSKR